MEVFLSTLFIAVGLAMDCLAVSISRGIAVREVKFRNALKIAFFFGGFQAVMPVFGWLAGLSMKAFIAGVDHWVAVALLGFVGGKMIYGALVPEKEDIVRDPFGFGILIMLSIATSIDALVIGIVFALLNVSLVTPVILIGTVTFVLSFCGCYVGNRIGVLFGKRIEIAGGLILIGIGVKILIEHLMS